jgi:hypothetical protein
LLLSKSGVEWRFLRHDPALRPVLSAFVCDCRINAAERVLRAF